MPTPKLNTAVEALAANLDGTNEPLGASAPFLCPYGECGAYSEHYWGTVRTLLVWPKGGGTKTREISRDMQVFAALCSVCGKESIFVDHKLVVPAVSQAPSHTPDLPAELVDDYEEARSILPLSPRGAAAMLRLIVQKLLPLIGAQEDDINKMIGELVAKGTISPAIQKALDSVRVIGNEAVHPGTMDLKDDQQTAVSLFGLINFIVEKAITEPKEIDAIYAGLPGPKLDGIANRDKPKTQN